MRPCFVSLIVAAVSLHASAVSTTNSNGSVMTPNSELTRNQLVATDVSGLLSSESDPNVVFTNGELLVHGERVKIGPDETEVQEIASAVVAPVASSVTNLSSSVTNLLSSVSDLQSSKADRSEIPGNYLAVSNKAMTAVQAETDPTIPSWAKQPNPPEGMTDNALVLTNGTVQTKGGTAVTPANIGAASSSSVSDLQSSKLDKMDVIDPAIATTNGPAADAKATKDALDTKFATVCLYEPEHPEYGGSTLRWINGYSAVLGFGYETGGTFYPQITFTDTPYGEIRHVGTVSPSRPWSWILIGNDTEKNTLQDALDAKADKTEGMTGNALVLSENGVVQTKAGDANLGEASIGNLHASMISNNDTYKPGPLSIVSPYMYAFVDKFIIGKTDQNPNGAYNVTIDEAGISAFNGESYFGFSQGRTGMIALENWQSLSSMLDFTASSDLAAHSVFSDAVLKVGLNIDTNSVAVLNEIADSFGGFPLGAGETATTVGGLLAALAAAVAWLKKNKVGSFDKVGGATATVDNGVAKLDNFFTESNSLLTGTIDKRLPYPLYAAPSTGLLKDRAINTTSLDAVTVPDNFTDLLIRASVASSLSVTMPAAITKYGDTFPGEAGEYLITITKTGAAEAYVRTIKLEEVA